MSNLQLSRRMTMHPLAPDLTSLSDDDLHKKRGELQQKLVFAYRMGQTNLIMQMQLLLEDYMVEIQKRNQKMLDDATKSGRNFQDKIDITK